MAAMMFFSVARRFESARARPSVMRAYSLSFSRSTRFSRVASRVGNLAGHLRDAVADCLLKVLEVVFESNAEGGDCAFCVQGDLMGS
jgi:hypothetical protein